ncbi:protein EMBRYONIC FLOWER 1-like isoform X1 [Neltuma alba]|uniref:protein EMBRYONIC FLOWER 1-like isoform X1 n=1 Tax=Neltuma alba TaxID=207710 RepID=UPI0010A59BE6|nr:protein EMBRYONIC FLOWER 1-like isoform X1 [Prosopis alba]
MGSLIQIDSISIDLANSIEKSDAGKCDHRFSIRGYVAEIREKDWKLCWPFPLQGNHGESEGQPCLLPPLDVPKFRRWCCQTCQQEIAAEGSDEDNQGEFHSCCTGCKSASNCLSNAAVTSDIQLRLASTPDTVENRGIDLNSSTNLSCGNDCLLANKEKEKKLEVAKNGMIDHETGMEGKLNHQLTSVPPPEVCPWLRLEAPTNDKGFEGNEVSDVKFTTSNLKCADQNSSEFCNGGTLISAHDQCQKELKKTCSILEAGEIVAVADHTTYDTTEHSPNESVASQKALPRITENFVENDFQDHHLEKSPSLPRRKPRKVRLLTDLLGENVEKKTEKFTIQGFSSDGTSEASATLQTLPPSVEGSLTNMDKSVKKFFLDEELKPAEISSHRVHNEGQNLEGHAEVNDTILDNRFKDVHSSIGLQENMKSYWSKPEIDRGLTMGKKKKKKIQVVDKHLRSYPYQNEENMHVVSKACASKTPSLSSSFAFSEKGMDNFHLHALKLGNKCNLSKQRGKMLQVDGDLGSLSSWENDKLVEDSVAVTGAKLMSNMPVVIPIASAQGSICNESGVKEGLHLSQNSYLAPQACNKKCFSQIDNQLPFSVSSQEGTSKVHNLVKKGRETDVVGESSIPYKQIKDAISDKGVSCEEITGSENTQKPVEAMEHASFKKTNGDQTADQVSEGGTLDDIPIEIVELMAKNQHERRLSEAENGSFQLTRCADERKAQMTVGSGIHGKGGLSLLHEGLKVKPHGRHGENGMSLRGENVRPGKRKSVHYFSPIDDGNHLNRNSLCQTQSSFPFEVSNSQKRLPNGFHFPTMGSSLCSSAQNCKMNGSNAARGSTDPVLQVQGGCSLHETILHPDDKASHVWAPITPDHLSLGYDIPKRVVSQSTCATIDMTSLQTNALHKQKMDRDDVDLNCLNLNATCLEKLNRNEESGTLNRMNAEYPFPCKHNGIEPQQNMRASLDLYSNEIIPAMHLLSLMDAGMKSIKPINDCVSAQMFNRPSYHGDCNSKLEIDKALSSLKQPSSDYYSKNYLSNKSHGGFLSSPTLGASSSIQHKKKFIRAGSFNNQTSPKSGKSKIKSPNPVLQNRGNKQFSWTYVETETETETPLQRKLEVHGNCVTLAPSKDSYISNSCSTNRNPADFTLPDMGNIYMIRGEDLKFEKPSNPKKRPSLVTFEGCKQQRNLKETKIKDHEKW